MVKEEFKGRPIVTMTKPNGEIELFDLSSNSCEMFLYAKQDNQGNCSLIIIGGPGVVARAILLTVNTLESIDRTHLLLHLVEYMRSMEESLSPLLKEDKK